MPAFSHHDAEAHTELLLLNGGGDGGDEEMCIDMTLLPRCQTCDHALVAFQALAAAAFALFAASARWARGAAARRQEREGEELVDAMQGKGRYTPPSHTPLSSVGVVEPVQAPAGQGDTKEGGYGHSIPKHVQELRVVKLGE